MRTPTAVAAGFAAAASSVAAHGALLPKTRIAACRSVSTVGYYLLKMRQRELEQYKQSMKALTGNGVTKQASKTKKRGQLDDEADAKEAANLMMLDALGGPLEKRAVPESLAHAMTAGARSGAVTTFLENKAKNIAAYLAISKAEKKRVSFSAVAAEAVEIYTRVMRAMMANDFKTLKILTTSAFYEKYRQSVSVDALAIKDAKWDIVKTLTPPKLISLRAVQTQETPSRQSIIAQALVLMHVLQRTSVPLQNVVENETREYILLERHYGLRGRDWRVTRIYDTTKADETAAPS